MDVMNLAGEICEGVLVKDYKSTNNGSKSE